MEAKDGPYAETKEWLGGLLILEAKDLLHAIQLISDHPGITMGRPSGRNPGRHGGGEQEAPRRGDPGKALAGC